MTAASTRQPQSVAELLAMAELEDVAYQEISGKRTERPEGDTGSGATSATSETFVKVAVVDGRFIVRCRTTLEAPDAEYVVEAEARYLLDGEVDIPSAIQREFSEKVGVMTVYPFLRSAILEMSSRLGAGRAVIPLLRYGGVSLT